MVTSAASYRTDHPRRTVTCLLAQAGQRAQDSVAHPSKTVIFETISSLSFDGNDSMSIGCSLRIRLAGNWDAHLGCSIFLTGPRSISSWKSTNNLRTELSALYLMTFAKTRPNPAVSTNCSFSTASLLGVKVQRQKLWSLCFISDSSCWPLLCIAYRTWL